MSGVSNAEKLTKPWVMVLENDVAFYTAHKLNFVTWKGGLAR